MAVAECIAGVAEAPVARRRVEPPLAGRRLPRWPRAGSDRHNQRAQRGQFAVPLELADKQIPVATEEACPSPAAAAASWGGPSFPGDRQPWVWVGEPELELNLQERSEDLSCESVSSFGDVRASNEKTRRSVRECVPTGSLDWPRSHCAASSSSISNTKLRRALSLRQAIIA